MTKRRLLALFTLLAVMCHAVVALASERVIPPGHESDFTALVAPYKLPGPIVGDRILANIDIYSNYVQFEIKRGDVHGPRLAILRMDVNGAVAGAFSFSSTPARDDLDPATRDAVARLESTVRAHATPAFAFRVLSNPSMLKPGTHHEQPVPTSIWMFAIILGVALGLGVIKQRPESLRALALVVGGSVAAIAGLGWFVSSRGSATQRLVADFSRAVERDRAAAELALAIAVGSLVALGDRAASWWRRQDAAGRRVAGIAALEILGVLAWSAFVRFALTRTNILTDGGSGYRRLMDFIGGYGGLSVLVDLMAPRHLMWSAIRVPAVLAALAPPLLTVLGRVLGFRRPIPLLAGLMLASVPLHAAMYTSDFLMGPLLTLTLLGLALAAAGANSGDDLPIIAGAGMLAFGTWCRPDGAIAGAPLLAVAWPVVKGWRRHPLAWLGFGLFGANMIAAQIALHALGTSQSFGLHLPLPDDPGLFLIPEDVPYWLSLGAALGIALFRRLERRLLVIVGVSAVTGLLPLAVRGTTDVTASYMEVFRYGTWVLPWLVLLAASGFVEAAQAIATRVGDPASAGRARRVERAALIGVALLVLSSPVRAHRYLAREYGPRAEEQVFREALRRVPDKCTLVVPDDVRELGRENLGTIEIEARYELVAAEQAGVDGHSPQDIVGVTTFLDALKQHGWPRGPAGGAPLCYWFFEGSYCYTGSNGTPSASCRELLARLHSRQVLDKQIEYVSHRFVTRPDLRTPPLYDPRQHLRLLELSAPPD